MRKLTPEELTQVSGGNVATVDINLVVGVINNIIVGVGVGGPAVSLSAPPAAPTAASALALTSAIWRYLAREKTVALAIQRR